MHMWQEKGFISSVLQELCHFVILTKIYLCMTDSAYFVKSTLIKQSVHLSNKLQIFYIHIADVHEEV